MVFCPRHNFAKNQYFSTGFFLEQYLHDLKTPFLGFSRDVLPPKKVVDHQSGQAKRQNDDFPNNYQGVSYNDFERSREVRESISVYNFFLVAEHLWKTPEMEFSDPVDIVEIKSHGKILFFRKVTAFLGLSPK